MTTYVALKCPRATSQIKDCSLPVLGDVFFIILILWGSFFTLNLLLAVLEGNFTKGKEEEKVNEYVHINIVTGGWSGR